MTFDREASSKMYSSIVFALCQLLAEMPYSVLNATVYFLLIQFMVRQSRWHRISADLFRSSSTLAQTGVVTTSFSLLSSRSTPFRWVRPLPRSRLRS